VVAAVVDVADFDALLEQATSAAARAADVTANAPLRRMRPRLPLGMVLLVRLMGWW
jgi:hypothetical protein